MTSSTGPAQGSSSLRAQTAQFRQVKLSQDPVALATARSIAGSESFAHGERKALLLWSKARRELGPAFDLAWANQYAFAIHATSATPSRSFSHEARLGVFIAPLCFLKAGIGESSVAPVTLDCPLFDNRGSSGQWLDCLDRATQTRDFLPFLFNAGLQWSADFQFNLDQRVDTPAGEPLFIQALEALEINASTESGAPIDLLGLKPRL